MRGSHESMPQARPGTARVLVTELSGSGRMNPSPAGYEDTETTVELYLSPAKLKSLCGTQDLSQVTSLEIGVDTREKTLDNFGVYLPELVELKLNNSVITSIRDLGTTLSHLQILWMSRCCLRDLEGLICFSSIEELYVAYNNVSDLSPVSALENLLVLDLEGNNVDDLVQVQYLGLCSRLSTLTLRGNPVCLCPHPAATQTEEYSYRAAVRELVPQLRYLDDAQAEEEEEGPGCSSDMGEEWAMLRDAIRDSTQAVTEDELTAATSTCPSDRPSSANKRPASSLFSSAGPRQPPTLSSPPSIEGSRPSTGSSRPASMDGSSRPVSAAASRVLSPPGSRPGSAASRVLSPPGSRPGSAASRVLSPPGSRPGSAASRVLSPPGSRPGSAASRVLSPPGSRPGSAASRVLSPPGSRPGSADSDPAAVYSSTSVLTHGVGKILFCGNPVLALRARREQLRTAPATSTCTPRDHLPIHVPEHTYDLEQTDVGGRSSVFDELKAWRTRHAKRLLDIERERLPQILTIQHDDEEEEEEYGDEEEDLCVTKSDVSDGDDDREEVEEGKAREPDTASPDSCFQSMSPDLSHRDSLSPELASLSPSPPSSAAGATGNQRPFGIRTRRLKLSLGSGMSKASPGEQQTTQTTVSELGSQRVKETQIPHRPTTLKDVVLRDPRTGMGMQSTSQHQPTRPLDRPPILRPHTARAVLQKHLPHHALQPSRGSSHLD